MRRTQSTKPQWNYDMINTTTRSDDVGNAAVIHLILAWTEYADLLDVLNAGIDVLLEMSPARDAHDDFVDIVLDSNVVVSIPMTLFSKTMAYTNGLRRSLAGPVPRQALFLNEFGHRFTLHTFCTKMRRLFLVGPAVLDAENGPKRLAVGPIIAGQ